MFKCCACNRRAKKDEENTETAGEIYDGKSKSSKNVVESSKIDKIRMDEKLNGGARKVEKNCPTVTVTVETSVGNSTYRTIGDPISNPRVEVTVEEKNSEPVGISENTSPAKSVSHEDPACVEKPIENGLEEEGDDSVFEAGPPSVESDLSKRAPSGTFSITLRCCVTIYQSLENRML